MDQKSKSSRALGVLVVTIMAMLFAGAIAVRIRSWNYPIDAEKLPSYRPPKIPSATLHLPSPLESPERAEPTEVEETSGSSRRPGNDSTHATRDESPQP